VKRAEFLIKLLLIKRVQEMEEELRKAGKVGLLEMVSLLMAADLVKTIIREGIEDLDKVAKQKKKKAKKVKK